LFADAANRLEGRGCYACLFSGLAGDMQAHWRDTIVKPETMQMFYELYMELQPPLSVR
jgi:hypothetical protein